MRARPPVTRFWISFALLLAVTAVTTKAKATGTWTQAPSSATNNGPAFGLWLLTDGTVLSHGSALNRWVILTPDKTGSYANGTWKTVASSNFSRGGAQEHVLKDGRFFEAGGEFLYAWPAHDGVAACASNCTNPAGGSALFKNTEIYDPQTNTWTVEPDAPYDIGDTGSATLPDGRILDSTRTGNQTQIFDPSTNSWSTGPANTNPNGDENSWSTLQNGGVLAVAPTSASIYDPVANKWIKTGALPAGLSVTLTAASGYPGTYQFGDNAGISLMFDGRVLAYGLGTTAIYTPGATASSAGTWTLGPNMPFKMGPLDGTPGNECEDEYTVTETNGKVMVATHPFGQAIDMLIEFDPTTNTFASITPPPDAGGPYPVSYLNLPNGQLMTTGGSRDWLYTPDAPPQDAWRPAVTSVTYDSSASTYTLTGTQLSGLINGGDEGDDMTMAENYPIVWLKDTSNNVYYCRSSNFSTMGPQVGPAPQTCQFTDAGESPGRVLQPLRLLGGRAVQGCLSVHRRRRWHRNGRHRRHDRHGRPSWLCRHWWHWWRDGHRRPRWVCRQAGHRWRDRQRRHRVRRHDGLGRRSDRRDDGERRRIDGRRDWKRRQRDRRGWGSYGHRR